VGWIHDRDALGGELSELLERVYQNRSRADEQAYEVLDAAIRLIEEKP
jgi:hypothetical protein